MDISVRRRLQEKKSQLIDDINCTVMLVARLNTILSNCEVGELNGMPSNQAKNYKLLEWVETRTNGLDILIDALDEENQSGAVEILKKVKGTALQDGSQDVEVNFIDEAVSSALLEDIPPGSEELDDDVTRTVLDQENQSPGEEPNDEDPNSALTTGNARTAVNYNDRISFFIISLLFGVTLGLFVCVGVFSSLNEKNGTALQGALPHISDKNELTENSTLNVNTSRLPPKQAYYSNEILLGGTGHELFVKGLEHITEIQYLYSNVKQLELLYFNNSNQQICGKKLAARVETALSVILIKNLQKLSLENFAGKCNKLYKLLVSHARFWNLKSLTFIGGELNFQSVHYFELILHETEESIMEINLNYTKVTAPLFSTITRNTFTQVHSIELNVSSTPDILYTLPKQFCQLFPRLYRFRALQLPLPLFAIESIFFGCTHLLYLEARVSIPVKISDGNIFVSEIQKVSKQFMLLSFNIPALQEIYLDIEFESCPTKGILKLSPEIPEMVLVTYDTPNPINFEITTNCDNSFIYFGV